MPKKEKRGFYLIFDCFGKKYQYADIASGIKRLIQHAGSGKTVTSEAAGIAHAAGQTIGICLIAGHGGAVVHA
jgi:hypothetical protein